MNSTHSFTDEELKLSNALHTVEQTDHPDDLVHLVLEDEFPQEARNKAAEKLLDQHTYSLEHVVLIADNAEEPYKSQANTIIDNKITAIHNHT